MKKIAKGFTLIELMIVVAIIGILAAIAIPNFVKYQLRSKFGEGTTNLEGLRKAEEALRQGERKITVTVGGTPTLVDTYRPGQYWNLRGSATSNTVLPVANCATPGTDKCVWGDLEIATAQALDWQVEGATYFQYDVSIAGCEDATFGDAGLCYFAGGAANIDGDANNGEVGLNRPSLDGTKTATPPTLLKTAWDTSMMGSCVDTQGNMVNAMPCTMTGPDVF